MVPRSVIFLERFPLSANGKVARGKLPSPGKEVLAPSAHVDAAELMAVPHMAEIVAAVAQSLSIPADQVELRSSFFQIGGDSLTALQLIHRLNGALGHLHRFDVGTLFANSSCVQLASLLSSAAGSPVAAPRGRQLKLVQFRVGTGANPPLVLIHAAGASALAYTSLLGDLAADRAVWIVDDDSLFGAVPFVLESIREVAEEALALLQAAVPHGPYLLGGWSYGGVVAMELAALLEARDELVAHVLLFDAPFNTAGSEPVGAPELPALPSSVASSGGVGAAELAQEHFVRCTQLLRAYECGVRLSAAVTSVRPQSGSVDPFIEEVGIASGIPGLVESSTRAGDRTSGTWSCVSLAAGSHWNMLFEPHASQLRQVIAHIL
jgi:hypothetical protein